jgi:hypothetical protein
VFLAMIFLSFGILSWVAVGVLLYFRRRTLRKTEFMRRVQTSTAAEAAGAAPGTPVEIKGTLRCESPLRSEMADQVCAYYLSRVVREYEEMDRDADGDSRIRRRSETVASNERSASFVVDDGSGTVGVRGEGAEVDALEVMDRFERDTGGSITLGGFTVNLGGGERTIGYRYVENILPVDAPVYVLGVMREDGEVGAPQPEDEGSQFLISYRSEEQLEKKHRKDAFVLSMVALGLFFFGAVFVAVGVAAAAGAF